MDAGGSSVPDWFEQWGIHVMEWDGLQFRDDHAGEAFQQGESQSFDHGLID